jgi:uncharacterized protein YukE
MTTLHMETEIIYGLSRQLNQQANVMSLQAGHLRRAAGKLSIAWQSPRADDFHNDLLRWLRDCEREIQRLENLGTRVHREVQEWESKDRDLLSVGNVYGLFDRNEAGIDIFKNFLNISRHEFNYYANNHTLQNFAGIGRDINDWLYNNGLVQNPKAGWVGRMYKLGKIGKNDAVMGWGIPIALNTTFGLIDGEDPLKAIKSAVINTGLKKGISYVFPVFGSVMLVNSCVQVAGSIFTVALDQAGYIEEAYQLQNGLDAIDVGGYIDDISNGLADMGLPPWPDPPDFSAVSERASKISNWRELVM